MLKTEFAIKQFLSFQSGRSLNIFYALWPQTPWPRGQSKWNNFGQLWNDFLYFYCTNDGKNLLTLHKPRRQSTKIFSNLLIGPSLINTSKELFLDTSKHLMFLSEIWKSIKEINSKTLKPARQNSEIHLQVSHLPKNSAVSVEWL